MEVLVRLPSAKKSSTNLEFKPAACCIGYAQDPEIKYKKQLGSKGSENRQFRTPHSLAVDRFGNIYVGDTGNKRVEKFYPQMAIIFKILDITLKDRMFAVLYDQV